jgi:ATP-dependent RNA/DNA helicase IGHMBP2
MGEADIVYSHVQSLLKLGIQEEDIAIISPYNEQVELLRRMLGTEHPAIEIKSVDGFQGREKEAVVMSLVRSNKKREVGFLKEDRRINVAITRARVHVAIVCDSVTVSSHPFLKSTIEYFESNGTVIPALDYNGTFDDGAGPRAAEFAKPVTGVATVGGKSAVSHGPKLPSSNARRGDKPFKASMTDEEKRQIRNIMRAKLTLFKESGEMEGCTEAGDGVWVNFPPTISGFSRMVVHEICEEVSLLHASHGEGSERYVSVARPASLMTARAKRLMKDQKTKHNIPASSLSDDVVSSTVAMLSVLSIPDDDDEEEVQDIAEGVVTTSLADDPNPIKIANSSPMPPLPPAGALVDTSSNALLAQLAKEREARKTAKSESVAAAPREAAADDEPKGGKTKSKKKKGNGSLKGKGDGSVVVKGKADALGDDLDDDALLDGLIALQNQCFKKGCKEKNVKLYGSNCPHCKQLYCLKHMQAETHGCDMAAREAGRESWLKSHATENHKKLKDWQRNSLSNQLNKKISDATDSRTSADAKEKDKKKKK